MSGRPFRFHARKSTSRLSNQKNDFEIERLEPRVMLTADIGFQEYNPTPILNPFEQDAVTYNQMVARAESVSYHEGEVIVAIDVPWQKEYSTAFIDAMQWDVLTGVRGSSVIDTMMLHERSETNTFALVHLDVGEHRVFDAMSRMQYSDLVLWTSPNFYTTENPLHLTPNDPLYPGQYHHPLMQNNNAWNISQGDPSIVVAITDDGVDIDHEDMAASIWVNPGEIANDGIDNDGNGYVDDVNGWDFYSNNNDPNPNYSFYDHGTHVAGISSGITDNATGISGTAGGTTIMPLQWYNYSSWTASVIHETYTYAVDNGANIINSSYQFDFWVGDPVVTAALQYLHDNEVLLFISAGNENQLNSANQAFEHMMIVASSTSFDRKSSFSDYGDGIDILSPGSNILSTRTDDRYVTYSGTSMASPNAAGAAALIWSANPTWNMHQVAAQLLATTDNVDPINIGFEGWLGSGRVNSYRALTEDIGAPQVKSFEGIPANGAVVLDLTMDDVTIEFTQHMDPDSVNNLSSYELREAGVDGIFNTSDDGFVQLGRSSNYMVGSNEFTLDFVNGTLGVGKYQLTLFSSALQNPFFTPLDGDADGSAGGDFITSFTIDPNLPVNVLPAGSLIYQQTIDDAIATPTDVDNFTIDLDEGQTLSVVVNGSTTLVPAIKVYDPLNNQLADVTGTGPDAFTTSLDVSLAGTYVLSVAGANSSTGSYELNWYLNAAVEHENYGGSANDTLQTAQDIDESAKLLCEEDADHLGVLGTLPALPGVPAVYDGFESGTLGSAWTTSSTASGRINVTGIYGTALGSFAMSMDSAVGGVASRNEAIWTVDLSNIVNPNLVFSHAEWRDEVTTLPIFFGGSVNGDGVSISDDGINWHRVFAPATQPLGQWQQVTIDLESAASTAGITLGPNFQVKFQQYGSFSISQDGRGFDEVAIVIPTTAEDWYSFALEDGESASIAATNYEGNGSVAADLFDAGGNLLVAGTVGENVSSYIQQYVDTTTDGAPNTYFIRVSGDDAKYSLVVSRNADFDLELNHESTEAQSITGIEGVLGYVTSESIQIGDPDDYPEGVVLDNLIPGVNLSNSVGGTSVNSSQWSFIAPTGSLVFSAGVANPASWGSNFNELRADFDAPTDFVSIDIGSDSPSDVGYLRAYNSGGFLVGTAYSAYLARGKSQTISISRPVSDIAYVIATGYGGRQVALDNLVFAIDGRDDYYAVEAVAGERLDYAAILPGEGPFLFQNRLAGPGGSSSLMIELIDPDGNVVDSSDSLVSHTATQSGTYQIRVDATSVEGEYYLQRVPVDPLEQIGESGTLIVGSVEQTITLSKNYANPVIIVTQLSNNEPDPATVRIDNVSGNSFSIHIDEWDYLDGTHANETIGYVVVEAGQHTLEDGTTVVAGQSTVDHNWKTVKLTLPSGGSYVAVASVNSNNDSASVVTRLNKVSRNSFIVKLQEEEAADGVHAAETVGWLAFEFGTATSGNRLYEAAIASSSLTNEQLIRFEQQFGTPPVVVAATHTYNEADTVNVRLRSIGTSKAFPIMQEEQSLDPELNHADERIGFIALDAGAIMAIPSFPPGGFFLSTGNKVNSPAGSSPRSGDFHSILNRNILNEKIVDRLAEHWTNEIELLTAVALQNNFPSDAFKAAGRPNDLDFAVSTDDRASTGQDEATQDWVTDNSIERFDQKFLR